MTRYETRSQWASGRSRRRAGFVGTILTLALGTYLLLVYLTEGIRTYTSAGSVTLLLAIFLYALTLLPLSYAIGNRPHPTSIEVSDEFLTLTFADGRVEKRRWEDGTVNLVLDTRTASGGKRRPPGLEVTLWMPVQGRDPGSFAVRPQQLIVSVHAFDEIRRRVRGAGYEQIEEMTRKGGTFLRFEKPSPSADP